MLDGVKSLIFTFMFFAIILVAMTQLPQLQGMPLEAKLSHIASATIQYIRELFSPLVNLYYHYFY